MNKRQVKVTIEGKLFEVEIEDLTTSPIKVVVNGKPYIVNNFETVEEGVALASTRVATSVPSPVYQPVAPKPAAQPANAASGNRFTSPMPGTVLEILIKAGDKVTPGQQLCSLEAMKMKSAIRSPREGIIASVEVTDKQRVAFGETLFIFR